ncbi:MAG TPA: NUDIX hydrolase [archaeon]|nr:NUDIX hydrolase [archaeon]
MPIEVVQAIILRGDPGLERVLVVKERGVRSRKLPGGTVNSGEDYITALQRELSEELSGVEIIRIHPKPQIEEKYVKKLGDTLRMRRYRVDISERSNPRPNNQYGEINWVGWMDKRDAEKRGFYYTLSPRKRYGR